MIIEMGIFGRGDCICNTTVEFLIDSINKYHSTTCRANSSGHNGVRGMRCQEECVEG